ncbi:FMN-binding protein [Terrilactibacillus laevilacticus]|uniref:FMN-binding protein n=1 Tax=Terrilactibacillus laevilacticus TaxID=1380157 RepID=A0ABW5PRX2_9BACI|nr:FMN-binding protein [Terrilactibacillus laevilacticus]
MSEKKKNSKKMNKKMIVLCTAAISSLYLTAYTETIHTSADQSSSASHFLNKSKVETNKEVNESKQDNQTNNKTTSNQRVYKDGVYNGSGSNHIGSVSVSVTIKNGSIAKVQITNCTTSYSKSYIDGLPDQVVQRQSSQVDVVSGATLSTEDFQTAVDQALASAKA